MKNILLIILLSLFFISTVSIASQSSYAGSSNNKYYKEEKSLKSTSLTVGHIINQTKKAVDELIQSAFNRLDLTAVQAAMEVSSLVDGAAEDLKDVLTFAVDELDGQQRRIVSDLQNFERLVATDIKRAMEEVREEKNSAISDLRLLLSKKPGAVRIIPSYALEGATHIDFQLLGTALSNAKFVNTKFNSTTKKFEITNQSDTRATIRIPLNKTTVTSLLRKSGGKPAEVKISFDFIERSLFDLIETNRRHFTATGFIMPTVIGSAKAVFSGIIVEKKTKKEKQVFTTKQVKSSIGWSGRKRGRTEEIFKIKPDRGWSINASTATFKFEKLNDGCSNGYSNVNWVDRGRVVKVIAVTDLGSGSVCRTRLTINYTQFKEQRKDKTINTPEKQVTTNSDVSFNVSSLGLELKNARLTHVEITSPLFENGTKIMKPNEQLGGLKLNYDPSGQIAYLQFEYF